MMSPYIVRHLLLPVHEALLRRPTVRFLRELETSQWCSADELAALQQTKLRRLLRVAHEHSPFYRERINAAGLDPEGVTLDSLQQLPALQKDEIRGAVENMLTQSANDLTTCTTGGSTGQPLQFYICRSRQAADQAARARSRRWFGIEPGERELYLWGSPVEVGRQDRVKRARDWLTNHRLLNAFALNDSNSTEYLDIYRAYRPVHLFGYPSSLVRWAQLVRKHGQELENTHLRAVFTTGEVLTPADRAVLEGTFSVPIADGYGARDAGFVAHQCLAGNYHLAVENMIVELLDAKGKSVSSDDAGEITVTHLDAVGMPLIRYRTGDMAAWGTASCPCGRKLMCLADIAGRQTDMLKRPDGGYAHALSLIYVLRDTPVVRTFQIEQQADLSVDIHVEVERSLSAADEARMIGQMRTQLGGSLPLRINQVARIATLPSGKHRHVVSRAT